MNKSIMPHHLITALLKNAKNRFADPNHGGVFFVLFGPDEWLMKPVAGCRLILRLTKLAWDRMMA
jgi:hypothetical protein